VGHEHVREVVVVIITYDDSVVFEFGLACHGNQRGDDDALRVSRFERV